MIREETKKKPVGILCARTPTGMTAQNLSDIR
jgi:hypothetical protein